MGRRKEVSAAFFLKMYFTLQICMLKVLHCFRILRNSVLRSSLQILTSFRGVGNTKSNDFFRWVKTHTFREHPPTSACLKPSYIRLACCFSLSTRFLMKVIKATFLFFADVFYESLLLKFSSMRSKISKFSTVKKTM